MEYASSVKGITAGAERGKFLSFLIYRYTDAKKPGQERRISKLALNAHKVFPFLIRTPAPVFQLVVDATGDRVFGVLFFMGFYSICTFISVHCSGCGDSIRIDPLHPGIVVMFVEPFFQCIFCRHAFSPCVVPDQCHAGHHDVAAHEEDQCQVMIFPGFIGIFSIQSDKRGYRSLNQTTAAMPQKKQYNRLILPPRLNGISL